MKDLPDDLEEDLVLVGVTSRSRRAAPRCRAFGERRWQERLLAHAPHTPTGPLWSAKGVDVLKLTQETGPRFFIKTLIP
jgi:hypothetical protein